MLDVTFEGNLARQGGGIYILNSQLKLTDNNFIKNAAVAPEMDESLTRNLMNFI